MSVTTGLHVSHVLVVARMFAATASHLSRKGLRPQGGFRGASVATGCHVSHVLVVTRMFAATVSPTVPKRVSKI